MKHRCPKCNKHFDTTSLSSQLEYIIHLLEHLNVDGRTKMSDVKIVKVKVLHGRAKAEAEKQGLKPDDLVVLRTKIVDSFPVYEVEKVKGDPVSFLLRMEKSKLRKVGNKNESPN